MECHFHPAFRWQDEQYGNAILSRYPMALIKSGPLPQWKDKRRPTEPRGALWVTVDLESQKVHIFNTHLSLWPRERSLQAEALLSEQWTGHPDCQGPLVVCGDFNALPRSTVYRKLCGRLRDSQRCLAGHRPQSTWSGRYPISRLDYIFISEDLQVRAIRVPRSQLEKTASDHLPLIAQLQLV
jgi:endonuclease/exonuclease/phosphatase family metal-dependent hydrolase